MRLDTMLLSTTSVPDGGIVDTPWRGMFDVQPTAGGEAYYFVGMDYAAAGERVVTWMNDGLLSVVQPTIRQGKSATTRSWLRRNGWMKP